MDQCAVGPNGELLDESKIVWVNDPDDPTPISPAPSLLTRVHPFFTGGLVPAVMVAGSRRSGRISKPSKRMLDPDNSERAEGSKRPKASRPAILESDTEDNEDPDDVDEPGATTDGDDAANDTDKDSEMADVEAAEEAYAATKAMGDNDRDVSPFFSANLSLKPFFNS
ncbi:hypothetical protein GALMADRAFT_143735 [Galerina marginata CBS 339.88]|uniref:Uncharacterized protein n=1 Tax=Galerina marginata (strain CBS 339.88) TaxID=685588 RepID=A0A067SN89_GALM3|nr:hypothetical protein GALMADRAFT_143735 [Galerina marginata CBS 339.88]